MNDQPATQAHEPARRFRRPTILDALIFTGAAAAGLAIARAGTLAGEGGRWQSFYCAAWFANGMIAGPAIIGAQYLRGRRGRLGFGEVVWLLPAALYFPAGLAGWLEAERLAGGLFLAYLVTHALSAVAMAPDLDRLAGRGGLPRHIGRLCVVDSLRHRRHLLRMGASEP